MNNSMITGGFGFVGRYLVRMLLERGDKVTIFDKVSSSEFLEDVTDRITVKVGDLSNWTHVAETVKENRIATIYHIGGMVPPETQQDPSAAFYSNIVGTFNILEAARLFGVKSIIFTSTRSVYGEAGDIVTDEYPQFPTNVYAMTKVCGERLGEAYWRRYGINFRGVRYPIVNGPGRRTVNASQLIVWAFQSVALGKPYKIFLEPETEVVTIYVKDAAKALIDLNEAEEPKLTRRVYNIAGYVFTAQQLVDVAKKYLPDADLTFRVNKEMMTAWKSWYSPFRFDISAAEHEWGFQQQFDLDKTMQDYIKECKENRHLLDYPIPEF